MTAPQFVVMGVSAVGKTTIGVALADRLGYVFCDADGLHSGDAVDRMAAGTPLSDADREPWLARCADMLQRSESGIVLACSALARRYRDAIRSGAPDAFFIHLAASEASVTRRASDRADHFMPVALVRSQFAVLEPLAQDEPGLTVDAEAPHAVVIDRILDHPEFAGYSAAQAETHEHQSSDRN